MEIVMKCGSAEDFRTEIAKYVRSLSKDANIRAARALRERDKGKDYAVARAMDNLADFIAAIRIEGKSVTAAEVFQRAENDRRAQAGLPPSETPRDFFAPQNIKAD